MPFATRASRLACGLSLLCLVGPVAASDGGDRHEAGVHHHLALFVGGGIETKRGHDDHDKGLATGLEYEARFHPQWGVGGVVELLGQSTVREVVFVAPVSFHALPALRLFAGPGIELLENQEKYLTRVGIGYEFEIGHGPWSVAPEGIADFVESGAVTWLYGVAIGYGF